jgi:virulence-associated protein VapD
MTATLNRFPRTLAGLAGGVSAEPEGRMYAIAFDMDTSAMQSAYPGPSWQNGYEEIRRILHRHGFTRQQGSVYFGSDKVNAVTCVLAVIDLVNSLPWFAVAVADIRMLRIEEQNNLMPAVEKAAGLGKD